MCRALRSDWDVDASAERIVTLDLDPRAVDDALHAARRLHHHDHTIATARAEQTLARALATLRPSDDWTANNLDS
jgi:hypothetical protein